MNRTIIASALATSLFVTAIASAETENALFPSNNASAQVSFYKADPTVKPDSVPLATAMINNSPFAATIPDIDAATHITVAHEGNSYTFALAESGSNKNDVWFDITNSPTAASYVSDTGTMSLSALMDGLSANPELLEELQTSAPGV